MDKQYTISRVRSDLRNEIYDLMTHVGYHGLEKELTESVLAHTPLYASVRKYSLDQSVPIEEKNEKKELFAYTIFQAMNASLGGFHFDRYRSLSTGVLETIKMNEIVESFDFDAFLENYDSYFYLKTEPDWEPFCESKQFRQLEGAITSSVKKNRVIPGVAKAIGKDIVDALSLTENYGYIRVSEELMNKMFDPPEEPVGDYVSLRSTPIVVDGEKCEVLLKRASRNEDRFKLLATNFGALIRGE
jgi:hypothetical protein